MKEKTLAERLDEINEKSRQWVAEDPDNRWASGLVDDLDHWKEYGITTAAQLDHYLAETEHWELYRSIHGIKPRWIDYSKLTTEEIEKMIDEELKWAEEMRKHEEELERKRLEEKKRVDELKRDAFDVERHSKEMHSLSKAFEDLM